MKTIVTATFLAAMTLALSACNTIHGMGRDIQSAGEAIQDAAN